MSVAIVCQQYDLPQSDMEVLDIVSLSDRNIVHWLDYLYQSRHDIGAAQRMAELLNLRELWRQRADCLDIAALWQLASLAEYYCDWSLLAEVTGRGLRTPNDFQQSFHDSYIHACWLATDYQTALDESLRASLLRPRSETQTHRYQQLMQWLQYSHQQCLGDFDCLQHEQLLLEPLGEHHGESFLWQYLDSDIPQRCCLPLFDSIEQWRQWYRERQSPDERIFAVLHQSWGFIGVVSLLQYRDIGFFYYWIGPDFQGNGYGPVAVSMLLQHAWQNAGLRCCYAKVFEDNAASISALQKLAFQPMPFRPQPPFADEILFYLGPAQSGLALRAEFSELLQFMDSEIVL